jgi:hypothetical protein
LQAVVLNDNVRYKALVVDVATSLSLRFYHQLSVDLSEIQYFSLLKVFYVLHDVGTKAQSLPGSFQRVIERFEAPDEQKFICQFMPAIDKLFSISSSECSSIRLSASELLTRDTIKELYGDSYERVLMYLALLNNVRVMSKRADVRANGAWMFREEKVVYLDARFIEKVVNDSEIIRGAFYLFSPVSWPQLWQMNALPNYLLSVSDAKESAYLLEEFFPMSRMEYKLATKKIEPSYGESTSDHLGVTHLHDLSDGYDVQRWDCKNKNLYGLHLMYYTFHIAASQEIKRHSVAFSGDIGNKFIAIKTVLAAMECAQTIEDLLAEVIGQTTNGDKREVVRWLCNGTYWSHHQDAGQSLCYQAVTLLSLIAMGEKVGGRSCGFVPIVPSGKTAMILMMLVIRLQQLDSHVVNYISPYKLAREHVVLVSDVSEQQDETALLPEVNRELFSDAENAGAVVSSSVALPEAVHLPAMELVDEHDSSSVDYTSGEIFFLEMHDRHPGMGLVSASLCKFFQLSLPKRAEELTATVLIGDDAQVVSRVPLSVAPV